MFSSVVFVLGLDFANRPLSILSHKIPKCNIDDVKKIKYNRIYIKIGANLGFACKNKTCPVQSERWLLMASAETNSLPKGRNVLRISGRISVFKL